MDQTPHRFPATASHPDLGEALVPGHVILLQSRIAFESEHHRFDAPFLGLQLEWSGQDGDDITFSHPNWADWQVSTTAPGPFSVPAFVVHPTVAAAIKAARSGAIRGSDSRMLARFSVAFAVVVLVVYFGFGLLHRVLIGRLPTSLDRELGEQALEELREEMVLADRPALQRRCQQLVDRMAENVAGSSFKFSVLVVETAEPNAYALPGGIILVTTGITNVIRSPEELAGVLAHEIGHVVRRHGVQQHYGSAGILRVFTLATGGEAGASSGLAAGSLALLNQSHSRDHEREADSFAVDLLARSGIHPSGLGSFLRSLMTQEASAGNSRLEKVFSSHPATEERVTRLEQDVRKLTAGRRFAPLE